MTTVVYKNGELGTDARISGNHISGTAVKAWRLKSGELLAACGDVAQYTLFKKWADAGFPEGLDKQALINLKDPEYTCIRIVSKTKILEYMDSIYPCEYKAKCYAWGSGAQFALGRLDAPKSTVRDAIKTAAKYDMFTGGRVRILKVGNKCTKKKKK